MRIDNFICPSQEGSFSISRMHSERETVIQVFLNGTGRSRRGKPSLIDSYADHHVLEVSDEIHIFVMNLIAMCARGALAVPAPDTATIGSSPCALGQTCLNCRCVNCSFRCHRRWRS